MILDARELAKLPKDERLQQRFRVFVDRREVNLCWYVDTELGFVRTHDVLGDATWHTVMELEHKGLMQTDWDNEDGYASRVIMGRIEVRPYEERKQ